LGDADVSFGGDGDEDAGASRRRGTELGLSVYESLESLVEVVDVAVVTVHPRSAPAVVSRLLEAGISMIAEKPLGLRADALLPLAQLAEAEGIYAAVTFVNRLAPLWDVLADQSGDLIVAEFRINNGPPDRYVKDGVGWMLDPEESGGGCLRNLGIHAADAVMQLAGESEVSVLSASLFTPPSSPIETHALAVVGGTRGWIAILEAGYNLADAAGSDYEWRVGTSTDYLIDQQERFHHLERNGSTIGPTTSSADRYHVFIGRCLEDLRRGRPPLATLRDCYRAALLVDRIYDHAQTSARS